MQSLGLNFAHGLSEEASHKPGTWFLVADWGYLKTNLLSDSTLCIWPKNSGCGHLEVHGWMLGV